MPIPFILGAAAAIAGVAGIGSGIHGAAKMKDANDTMKSVQARHERNTKRFETEMKQMQTEMDKLGKKELELLKNLDQFATIMDKVRGRQERTSIVVNGVSIPIYKSEALTEASTGAAVLLGGLKSAALGTAGSFAAAGAVTAAVAAVGTASTGTAIASLGGVAATNAVLATLGGGAIAAGGGGVALGSALLGAATAGVGLLVGGIVFNISGSKLSDKADQAWADMKKAEEKIDNHCAFFADLIMASEKYSKALDRVQAAYMENFQLVERIVDQEGKRDYTDMSYYEKTAVGKAVAISSQLYRMCNVQLVKQPSSKDGVPSVNWQGLNQEMHNADLVCKSNPELDVEL